ncbi:uncharacterized protein [Drosophila kikkawai]|uniref:Uncharacterized protein n=1 Tax=Drosophila kikkawai TaxID=30033 RepID=A0A6P4IEG4_DROKI|nr:uncharacterized protein LOC108074523 [Drosophila kikkawai]
MCEVQNMLNGLCQMFSDAKERRNLGMIQILEKVRCCECGHRKRLQKVRENQAMLCGVTATSPSTTRILIFVCFVLMILFCAYFIFMARRYNHVRAYGSNACGSSFFYSYSDCDVIC